MLTVKGLFCRRPSKRHVIVTRCRIEARITASTSSGSDDHKPCTDSLYVEDLSDSAVASPYEKEVSFKSEVALFSPRSSSDLGEYSDSM